MRSRYSLLPSAEFDLSEQMRYIAERNPQASLRFHAAVKHACEQLADLPHSGEPHNAVRPGAVGLRVTTLPKFPYRIYYRVVGRHAVEVVRILHTSRDLPQVLQDLL